MGIIDFLGGLPGDFFHSGAGREFPLNPAGLGCKFLRTDTVSSRAARVGARLQSGEKHSGIKLFSQLLQK